LVDVLPPIARPGGGRSRDRLTPPVRAAPPRHHHPTTGEVTHGALSDYMAAPMVCGCVGVWANVPTARERLLAPWARCAARDACLRPKGADGFKQGGKYLKGHEVRRREVARGEGRWREAR
jgi:hypothetical protein